MIQVLDFVPIWTLILGMAVFFYVLLDGFDLGVGMLFGLAPDAASRNTIMNTIAPIWDGNETWLVFGGLGLLAAFPLAFAIIIPAVYFPILVMLLALVFRGVAFEFRFRDAENKTFWDHAFCFGSGIATFAQGMVLGTFIQGFRVSGRQFAGTSFDFLSPFALLTAVALLFGYGLLGAGWLILKTEGAVQAAARHQGRICLIGVLLGIGIVSIWTPLHERNYRCSAGSHGRTFCSWRRCLWPLRLSLGSPGVRSAARRRSHALPWGDRPLRALLSRHRHQPLSHDRAAPFHAVAGGIVRPHAGLPAGRHARAAARDPHVHRMVLLGVPRQGSVGRPCLRRRASHGTNASAEAYRDHWSWLRRDRRGARSQARLCRGRPDRPAQSPHLSAAPLSSGNRGACALGDRGADPAARRPAE